MNEKELGYLEKIQQQSDHAKTQEFSIQNNDKQGEIIDLRSKPKPTLEGDNENLPK